jgi:hypothetical protein
VQINLFGGRKMKKFKIDLSTTEEGLRFFRKLNVDEIKTVTMTKIGDSEGGPAEFTLTFIDGDELTINNAFGIGFGGEGPCGAAEILNLLGVENEEVEKLFTYYSSEPLVYKIK